MPSTSVNYCPHRFIGPPPQRFQVDQQAHHDLSTIGEVSHEGASTIADDNNSIGSTMITDILDMQNSNNNNNKNDNGLDKSGEAVTASFSHDSSEDGEFWPCSPPLSPKSSRNHQTATGPAAGSTRLRYPIIMQLGEAQDYPPNNSAQPPPTVPSRTNKYGGEQHEEEEETREVPRWLRLFVVACLILVVLSVVVIAIAGAKMMRYQNPAADNNNNVSSSAAAAASNSKTPTVGDDFVGNTRYGSNSPPQPQSPAEDGDEPTTLSEPANETSTISLLHTSNTSEANEEPPAETPVPESSTADEEDKEEADKETFANANVGNHQGDDQEEQTPPQWPPTTPYVPPQDEPNVEKGGDRLRRRRRLGHPRRRARS